MFWSFVQLTRSSGLGGADPACQFADQKTCQQVCRALGIAVVDIGLVLRMVLLATNMHNQGGMCDWNPFELFKLSDLDEHHVFRLDEERVDLQTLKTICCRGGRATHAFTRCTGQQVPCTPGFQYGSEFDYPESPWRLLPRVLRFLTTDIPAEVDPVPLVRHVNTLVAWSQRI